METINYGPELYQEGQEQPNPLDTEIQGELPKWIKGAFLRVGPGKFKWGDSVYNHWFEGDALLHRFHVENGTVKFSSRFLESASYLEAQKRGTIARSNFATFSLPDPCKNIFKRFMLYYLAPDPESDNGSDNIIKIKDDMFSIGDLVLLCNIDKDTLQTKSTMNVAHNLSGHRSWTSHPHFGDDGTLYNCSAAYDKDRYEFIRIPPAQGQRKAPLDGIEVVAAIPMGHEPTYFHSFGMTENYFIFIEGSMFLGSYFKSHYLNELTLKLFNKTHRDMMIFKPEIKSRFHVVDRKSGKLAGVFATDPFFCFHQVNAYEENGEIVFDITAYPDASVIDNLYLCEIREGRTKDAFPAELRRYRLPLQDVSTESPVRCILSKYPDGLDHEMIHPSYEMPKINYDHYNTKKYQYTYGTGNSSIRRGLTTLLKINVDTKVTQEWEAENCYPSEPVFLPAPNATKEDEGIIMSAVVGCFGQRSFLLFLDGETMTEVARAYVPTKLIPLFHGDYFAK